MITRSIALTTLALAALASGAAMAQDKPMEGKPAMEKCYGVALAGKNDCASTGNNSCGGSSKLNSDPKAWVYVPAGYCDRIVGGSLQPK